MAVGYCQRRYIHGGFTLLIVTVTVAFATAFTGNYLVHLLLPVAAVRCITRWAPLSCGLPTIFSSAA